MFSPWSKDTIFIRQQQQQQQKTSTLTEEEACRGLHFDYDGQMLLFYLQTELRCVPAASLQSYG